MAKDKVPNKSKVPSKNAEQDKSLDQDMTRIHIWLSLRQINLLNETARVTGLSRSYILRDAINHWFNTRAEEMITFVQQT